MLQLHLSDQQFHYLPRRVLYERFDGMHGTRLAMSMHGTGLAVGVCVDILMMPYMRH